MRFLVVYAFLGLCVGTLVPVLELGDPRDPTPKPSKDDVEMNEVADLSDMMAGASIESSVYDKDFVKPDQEGSMIDSSGVERNAYFDSVADDVLLLRIEKIYFLSTYTLVKAPAVVGDYLFVNRVSALINNRPVYVDMRFIDGEPTDYCFQQLSEVLPNHRNRVIARLVLQTNPILIEKLEVISMMFDDTIDFSIHSIFKPDSAVPNTLKRRMSIALHFGISALTHSGFQAIRIPMTPEATKQAVGEIERGIRTKLVEVRSVSKIAENMLKPDKKNS